MEKKKLNLINIGFLTSFLFLMNSFTLFTKDVYKTSTYLIIGLSGFVYIYREEIIVFYKKILKNHLGKIWFIFLLLVFLSEIVNGNIQDSLFYIFVLPSLYIHTQTFTRKEFFYSVILSIIPYLLIVLYLISQNHWFGSNSISLIISVIPIAFSQVLFSEISQKQLNQNISKVFFYYALTILPYIFIFPVANYIGSRTSLLILTVSFVMISIVYFSIVTNEISNKNLKKYLYILLTVFSIFILYKLMPIVFQSKWRPEDISTGRFKIWKETIKNFRLFGNGYYWYRENNLVGPHNLFIGLLGFSGFFTLSVFIYFFFLVLWEYYFAFKNRNLEKIFMLTVVFSLLTKGLTEGMLLMSFFNIYNILFVYEIYNLMFYGESSVNDLDFRNEKSTLNFKKTSILLIIILGLIFVLLLYIDNFDLVQRYLNKYFI